MIHIFFLCLYLYLYSVCNGMYVQIESNRHVFIVYSKRGSLKHLSLPTHFPLSIAATSDPVRSDPVPPKGAVNSSRSMWMVSDHTKPYNRAQTSDGSCKSPKEELDILSQSMKQLRFTGDQAVSRRYLGYSWVLWFQKDKDRPSSISHGQQDITLSTELFRLACLLFIVLSLLRRLLSCYIWCTS